MEVIETEDKKPDEIPVIELIVEKEKEWPVEDEKKESVWDWFSFEISFSSLSNQNAWELKIMIILIALST